MRDLPEVLANPRRRHKRLREQSELGGRTIVAELSSAPRLGESAAKPAAESPPAGVAHEEREKERVLRTGIDINGQHGPELRNGNTFVTHSISAWKRSKGQAGMQAMQPRRRNRPSRDLGSTVR
jgi:hypothetical protein